MRNTILTVVAVAAVAALTASTPSAFGQTGYEGVSPQCLPSGAKYSTFACCMERGLKRHFTKDYTKKWCVDHGFPITK